LAGPTYFEEFLLKISAQAKENVDRAGLIENRIYSVIIVITDGNCHDMIRTKDLIVKSAKLPFSSIIVGVGDSDFKDMEVLDADEEKLTDNEGNEAVRDVVQLV
jgi:hypothetical protein